MLRFWSAGQVNNASVAFTDIYNCKGSQTSSYQASTDRQTSSASSMAGSFVAAKGFISLNNLGGSSTNTTPSSAQGAGKAIKNEAAGRGGSGQSQYGGRVDVTKTINEIKFCLSLTDASVKTVENAPKIEGVILTGQKRINGELPLHVTYLKIELSNDGNIYSETSCFSLCAVRHLCLLDFATLPGTAIC